MPAIPPSIVAVLLSGPRDHEANAERRLLTRLPSKRKRIRTRRHIVLRQQPSDWAMVSTRRSTDRHVDDDTVAGQPGRERALGVSS